MVDVAACAICLSDKFNDASILNCCTHKFCFACIRTWCNTANTCPLCKKEISKITHGPQGASLTVKRKRQAKPYRLEDDEALARILQDNEPLEGDEEEEEFFLFYGVGVPPDAYELDGFVVPDSSEDEDDCSSSSSSSSEELIVIRSKKKKTKRRVTTPLVRRRGQGRIKRRK